MSDPTDDHERLRGRLRWRCRRGMRELDELLLRYLEHEYPAASREDQQAFQRIIDLQDPDLFGYLVRREMPADASLHHVIARLRHVP